MFNFKIFGELLYMNDKNNKINIETYNRIFRDINENYVKYSNDIFCIDYNKSFNLNKFQVRDIVYNGTIKEEFKECIKGFCLGMGEIASDIEDKYTFGYEETSIYRLTTRTKTYDSTINKVIRKLEDDEGRYPINKYLNDLVGFRIIDSDYGDNIESVKRLLDNNNYCIQRHGVRNSGDYKAYHIYFKQSNYSFPIEIQLWDSENEAINIKSHKEYKQSYIEEIANDIKFL